MAFRLKVHAGRAQDIMTGGALFLIMGAMLLIVYFWTASIPVKKYASDTFDHYDADSAAGLDLNVVEIDGKGEDVLYPDCSLVPVGIDDKLQKISASRLSASSVISGGEASHGRLNFKARSTNDIAAWMPAKQDKEQWIQVDLGEELVIGGLLTQGEDNEADPKFVRTFKLQYSHSGDYWNTYVKTDGRHRLFVGNSNGRYYDLVQNRLEYTIRARYIRICPQEWNNKIALRFEILHCTDEL